MFWFICSVGVDYFTLFYQIIDKEVCTYIDILNVCYIHDGLPHMCVNHLINCIYSCHLQLKSILLIT